MALEPAKHTTVILDTDGGSKFRSSNVDNAFTGLASKALSMIGSSGSITLTDDDPMPELKSTRKVVDVVNDFSWYAGPKMTSQALDKVPCALIQEREQLLSSLVSGAMYYLDAAGRGLGGSSYHKDTISSLVGSINDAIGNLNGGPRKSDLALLEQNNLNSLKGIYFTRETGFNYRLPMYDNIEPQAKALWDTGNTDSGTLTTKVVKAGQTIFRNVAEIVNLGQPGVYIEEPKYFQGAEHGESRTIKFPLSNTIKRGAVSPIQQNYELMWLLAFQNKPYRTSFSRSPPPKIYSIVVPGQFSFPYAYISNMSVNFLGTTRNTTVWTPAGNPSKSGGNVIGSKQIKTPVPDAYEVSLTFTSLIGSYGNNMLGDMWNTDISNGVVTHGRKAK